MRQPECVLFVPEVEAFGGAERGILALCRWLHTNQVRHRVVSYYDSIGLAKYAGYDLPTTILNPKRNWLSKVRSLRRYLGSLEESAPKPLGCGIQAALHLSFAGAKGYHTLMFDTPSLFGNEGRTDSLPEWIRQKVTYAAIRRGLRSGGTAIVNSEFLASETRQLFGGHVVISRMGGMAPTAAFRPRKVDGKVRMLTVSRVEANKRIDWILHGLASLEQGSHPLHERADWHLDVVGKGSLLDHYREECKRLEIASRVTFHGFVSDAELETLFEEAHLFLMPARQGYGVPALEALYRGVPVLLHRESGVSDILLNTPWCEVMQGGSENMAEALDRSIRAVQAGRHVERAIPVIPTEDEWARSVAVLCGWLRVEG